MTCLALPLDLRIAEADDVYQLKRMVRSGKLVEAQQLASRLVFAIRIFNTDLIIEKLASADYFSNDSYNPQSTAELKKWSSNIYDPYDNTIGNDIWVYAVQQAKIGSSYSYPSGSYYELDLINEVYEPAFVAKYGAIKDWEKPVLKSTLYPTGYMALVKPVIDTKRSLDTTATNLAVNKITITTLLEISRSS